ncbi:hypothetical protein [Saccharopolyspora sp. NPDC002376]
MSAAHQVGTELVALGGGMARDLLGSYDEVWISTVGLCAMAAPLATVIRARIPSPAI